MHLAIAVLAIHLGVVLASSESSDYHHQIPNEGFLGLQHNESSNGFDAGYVQVRPGAHMFWLLEPCRHCSHLLEHERPWILWLQGGPGASGVGYGNMAEIGPYTAPYWLPRSRSWADLADLVFVDNPVGTGFSYVTNSSLYVQTNDEIVADLMTWLRALLDIHPRLARAPMYIFCESYGGKMGLGLAQAILRDAALTVNLRQLALGDSWISPMHFMRSWGPLLRAWSLLDDHGVSLLDAVVNEAATALAHNNGTAATLAWGRAEALVGNLTDNVDWYNMRKHNTGDDDDSNALQPWVLRRAHPDPLTEFMNGPFRQRMGQRVPSDVQWGGQSGDVFAALAEDFMRPVVDVFDDVLSQGLPVVVYEGQLDLICGTLGFEMWLRDSKWVHLDALQATPRRVLRDFNGVTTGFVKHHRNLRVYFILEAGHMVPIDEPDTAYKMVFDLLYGLSSW